MLSTEVNRAWGRKRICSALGPRFTSQNPCATGQCSPTSTDMCEWFYTQNRLSEGLKFKAIRIWNCTIVTKSPSALEQAKFTTREHQQTEFCRAFCCWNQTTNIKTQYGFNSDTINILNCNFFETAHWETRWIRSNLASDFNLFDHKARSIN